MNDSYPSGKKVISAGKTIKKSIPSYTIGRNINQYSIVENKLEISQKLKIDPQYDPAILLLGINPKKMKPSYEQDTVFHFAMFIVVQFKYQR